LLARLDRREEAEFFEAPLGVVGVNEVVDGGAELFERAVGSAVDDLLFEGAVKALGDAVGLGLFDEGKAGGDPPVLDLVLEVVGDVISPPWVGRRLSAAALLTRPFPEHWLRLAETKG
jgi:hypothetical protein